MKIIIALISVLFVFVSCEKTTYEEQVKYMVTRSAEGFNITYVNENGDKVKEYVNVASEEEEWTYSFKAHKGDIVFVSVTDTVPESFVKAYIYVNGKVYKQGCRDDEPAKPVVVSGVVPY